MNFVSRMPRPQENDAGGSTVMRGVKTQNVKYRAVTPLKLMNFLFPPFCPGCQVYLGLKASPRQLCRECAMALRQSAENHTRQQRGPHPIDLRWSMAGYRDEPLATLIHKLKYHRKDWIIEALEPFIEKCTADIKWNSMVDAIVPVPLHPSRLRRRGFNQAEIIALAVSRQCGLPVLKNMLARAKATKAQKNIKDPSARRLNVKNAFKAMPPVKEIRRILLVDDVSTTGATLKECALALEAAGAQKIHAFTLAH
ncbi:MAG: ComF family protein [Elusimicrobia bacterium]|nr:ComF family protein [Elusimicrobiota bacterium]